MGKNFARTRRMVVALALLLNVVVVPAAASADEGEPYWMLSSSPVTVTRGGVDYKMSISASDFGFDSVSITLSKRKNPEGPADLTQRHTFTFPLSKNRFVHPSEKLASAAVDTAGEMGDYGGLDVAFNQTKPLDKSCNGHTMKRTGVLSGSVAFKTLTSKFGVIKNLPAKATLLYSDGACGGGGSNACPAAGSQVTGYRSLTAPMSLYAAKAPGADTASFNLMTHGSVLQDEVGRLSSQIVATLPAAKVTVANDLSTGSIAGVNGTWLTGLGKVETATPTVSEPTNCGTDKQYVTSFATGPMTGDLKVNFFLGSDRSLQQGPVPSTLYKIVVQPRP